MTAHPTPAERLLAMLDDPDAVESLSADEVRADLKALGIDAGPATAVVNSLAASRESPAARLLGAIDDAEDAEAQIARLETADLEAVRQSAPRGRAAALTGKARRLAGTESNVVGLEPRRRGRRILVWGGAFGGVAASLLVAMVMTRSYLADTRLAVEPPHRQVTSESLRPAPAEPAGPQADVMAESAERRDEPLLKRDAKPAPPATLAAPEPERFADDSAIANKPAAGLAGGNGGTAATAERSRAQAPSVAAMLLVDPDRAPTQLQSQTLPAGRLAGRLEEARRLAGDRPVIALFTVEGEAGVQDYAQVPLAPRTTQQQLPPPPLARLLVPDAAAYDFIPLP